MKFTYLLIVVDFILSLILFPSDFHLHDLRVFLASYFLFDCTLLIVDILKSKGYLTIFEDKKGRVKNDKK